MKQPNKKAKKGGGKPVELLNEFLKDTSDPQSEVDPLQGFKVIKWKIDESSDAVHHFFVKKHLAAITEVNQEKPIGRTLLCQNVPPYITDVHLREIFGVFGSVVKIFVHQKPTSAVPEKRDPMFPREKDEIRGYKVAYIVFKKPKAVEDIMELRPEDITPIVLKRKPVSGLHRWIRQYNQSVVSTSDLETSVRKFMENFDKEELKKKEMEKNGGEPDEEGWITVTRTGKRASGGAIRSEAMEERLKAKKRRQDKQLLNFTPAQMKESKMKQLIELKKKFEEDKQRVALLKQQRKFKPF